MMQHDAIVLSNTRVNDSCWLMALAPDADYGSAMPGQFVMFQMDATGAALLRRPFSIAGITEDLGPNPSIEIIYKTVGQVTHDMTDLGPGNRVNLLGPLGRGFDVPEKAIKLYFVAGGIGVAPIRFLVRYLQAKGRGLGDCRFFLGGRNKEDLLCSDELDGLGLAVSLTTDDGTAGRQCLITDPLADCLQGSPPDYMFACGPPAMLQCVAGLAKKHQIPCQVSMESHMACGIGACLGCAVAPAQADAPYLHVCKDGPVFAVSDLAL